MSTEMSLNYWESLKQIVDLPNHIINTNTLLNNLI